MTSLAETIAALEPDGGGWRGTIPHSWLQGRTAYGGLSSALALHAALQSDDDLPPLRSAQVAFIGPLSGDVVLRAQRLRRGRNAAFVQADIESAAGLGLRATFVFMAPIESSIDLSRPAMPDFAAPTPTTKTYFGHSTVPFSQNFELLDQREGLGPAEFVRWVRLRERHGIHPMVELIAIADCLPPAAMKLLSGFAPISSMTWLLNLLAPAPVTRDGWWLLRANADHARDGSSSQQMAIWNTDGDRVAEQMQSVAIFA